MASFVDRDKAVSAMRKLTSHWADIERGIFEKYSGSFGQYVSAIATHTLSLKLDRSLNEPSNENYTFAMTELDNLLSIDSDSTFDMSGYYKTAPMCKSCGNLLLVTFKQKRSADEGMTMVTLPCASCN